MYHLYTIGHSTRSLAEFLALLEQYEITYLIDVRTIPKSRRFPWFNQVDLKAVLKKQNIHYFHFPELGGLRHAKPDSINSGWRNASFRGFADYMQTLEFFHALKRLNDLIKTKATICIMCAEAVPWRCHRSLIADAEIERGVKVNHIINHTSLKAHVLTPFAQIDKTRRPMRVYYPEITKSKTKKTHHNNQS